MLIGLSLYLLLGALVALLVDQHHMKQHVPYGDFPSVAPLHMIRMVMAICVTLFGPVILLRAAADLLWQKLSGKSG